MADVLQALEALEKEDKAKNPTNTKQRRPQSRSSRRGSTGRPQALPPPRERQTRTQTRTQLSSPQSDYAPSVRSESQGPSSRRISFAEPARPSATSKRIWIATNKASLASGFPFDPRLQKYGIVEEIWKRFNNEILELAEVPGPWWLWVLHRKEVIGRIKKDLQYEGTFKRKLKVWNKVFKMKGFQIELALPGEQLEEITETDDDQEPRIGDAKKDAKRFRIIITPNAEKATSVYSRSSSLTRSVTGEANLQRVASNQSDADHHQESDELDDP